MSEVDWIIKRSKSAGPGKYGFQNEPTTGGGFSTSNVIQFDCCQTLHLPSIRGADLPRRRRALWTWEEEEYMNTPYDSTSA